MSAASSVAPTPLLKEGTKYWDELIDECKRQIQVINSVVARNGLGTEHCVDCADGPEFRLVKSGYPSTTIKLRIGFYSWAPMISVAVTGYEEEHFEFFPEEWEMPMAMDLDGAVVAIFDEGRSFSPRELATFLTQCLRRCYPSLPLH